MFRRSKTTQQYQPEDFRSSGKKRKKKKGSKDDKKKKKSARATPAAETYAPAPRWKPPAEKKVHLGKGVPLFEPPTEQPQFSDSLISTTNFLCLFSGKPGLSVRRRTDQGAAVTSPFLARILTMSEPEPFLQHVHTVLLRGVGRSCAGKDWQRGVASTIYSEKFSHWFHYLHPLDEYVDKDIFYATALGTDDRIEVLKTLCEMQFEFNETFAKHIAKEQDVELRPPCFGQDSHHNRYWLLEETEGFLLCREAIKKYGLWEVVCTTVGELKDFHEHFETTQHKYEIKMRDKLDEWLPTFEIKSKKANEHNRKLARIAASLGGGAFEFGDDVMAPRSRRSTCKAVDYSSKEFDQMIAHGVKEPSKEGEPVVALPTRRQQGMNRWDVPEPVKPTIDYANLTSRQRAMHGQAGVGDPADEVLSDSASRSWNSDASDGESSEDESDNGYQAQKMTFWDTILQQHIRVSIKFQNCADQSERVTNRDFDHEAAPLASSPSYEARAALGAIKSEPNNPPTSAYEAEACQQPAWSSSVSVEEWSTKCDGGQSYIGKPVAVLEEAFKIACPHGYIDTDYPGGPQQRRGPQKNRLIVDATGAYETDLVERVWGYFSDAETSATYKNLAPVQFGAVAQQTLRLIAQAVAEIPAAEPPQAVAEIPAAEPPQAVAEIPAAEPPQAVAEIPAAEPPQAVAEIPAAEPPADHASWQS